MVKTVEMLNLHFIPAGLLFDIRPLHGMDIGSEKLDFS